MSKRANGEGTYFKRKDGRWQGQHSARGPLGEPVRRTVYGKTQAEVRQKLRALEQHAAAGVVSAGRPATLAAFGEQWLNVKLRDDIAQGHLAEGTRTNYRNIWTAHVEPDLGHLRLDALTPQVLRAWMTGKTTQPSRLGRPLSERTRQLIFSVLRKALNDARRDGLIPRNPLEAVRAPKVSRRAASPLSNEEVAALLRASEGDRLLPLLVLMLGTGARPGEALAAAWSQLDLDQGWWKINRSLTRVACAGETSTRLGFTRTKTPASEATVVLPQAAIVVLRQHRTQQAAERLAAELWRDADLVFTTTLGTPLERGCPEARRTSAAAR